MTVNTEVYENPRFENLLISQLEGARGTEVVVSRVTLPPNASPPLHWHPGEEFAYLISGSLTLLQEGKEDVLAKAGDAVVVPFKQVHSIKTHAEPAIILVFRVHESGQPERFLVN